MVFLVRYEHCIFGFRCPLVGCSNCRHASINKSLGEASMRRGLLCCTLFDGLQPLQTKTYIFPSALCVSFGRSLNVGLALRLRTFHSNLGIPLSPEVDFLYIAITNNDSCPYRGIRHFTKCTITLPHFYTFNRRQTCLSPPTFPRA